MNTDSLLYFSVQVFGNVFAYTAGFVGAFFVTLMLIQTFLDMLRSEV